MLISVYSFFALKLHIFLLKAAKLYRLKFARCRRQGVERHTAAAAADVFCWRAEADESRMCGTRTAYKNTAGARQIERNTRPVALINILSISMYLHNL
jgi:hypothetical protein